MKSFTAKSFAFACFLFLFGSAVHAGQETYAATLNAPAHLVAAENLVTGIRLQTYNGYLGGSLNGVYVPYNQYGGGYEDMHTQWGQCHWKSLNPAGYGYGMQMFVLDKPWMNNTVCGNFVTSMLKEAYGWNWASKTIPGENQTASPNARLYSKAIENGIGFTKIDKVSSLKAGDIISVDYKTDPESAANSGHVMIFRNVKSTFITTPNSENSNKYKVWALSVVDSTSQPHDSRFNEEDSRNMTTMFSASCATTGAGIGEFRIITNESGSTILGWTWGWLSGVYSKTYSNIMTNSGQNQASKPISLGRVN